VVSGDERCGCEGWGEGLESEADCVRNVARQDAGKLGNELCKMGCVLRQVYVRLYLFGSRGHGSMHRGTFGGSAIGVSQYALKYRHAREVLDCSAAASRRINTLGVVAGRQLQYIRVRGILPGGIVWYVGVPSRLYRL
jgi:hypothetical protein